MSSVKARDPIETAAASAYAAFHELDTSPPWAALPDWQREKWRRVARAVIGLPTVGERAPGQAVTAVRQIREELRAHWRSAFPASPRIPRGAYGMD